MTLLFRAKLNHHKRTYRDIEISDNASLFRLAETILDAFGFQFDHCFGFYPTSNIFGRDPHKTHYELFVDLGEEHHLAAKSVKKTKAKDLWDTPKQKWWMLFDYGDDWVFEIELRATTSTAPHGVIRQSGEAPKQYE